MRKRTDHLYMPQDHMEAVYASPNPLVRGIHQGRLEAIASQIPEREESLAVLDAGCGEGHLLERLHARFPHYQYAGIDITEVALERVRERCPFVELHKLHLAETGYNDESFDVVTCTEVIEHVYEYDAVLRELKRILKPGGFLIVTFPNEALWTAGRFLLRRKPMKVPDHVNTFTPRLMKKLIGLPLIKQVQLPMDLPFIFSLGCLMTFQKEPC